VSSQTTLVFKRINSDDIDLREARQLIKNNAYAQGVKQGFIIRETAESELVADYIFHFPTFVDKFDEQNLVFVKEQTIRTMIINFSLNWNYDLLTIYTRSSTARRLISELLRITEFRLAVDDINFTPDGVIRKFRKSNLPLNIDSLKIKNFSLKRNVIGTFNAKVSNSQVARELLEEYAGDIPYFGCQTEYEQKIFHLGFYEGGAIRFSGDEDNQSDLIDKVKKILFQRGA
jgi:hypothetical protein